MKIPLFFIGLTILGMIKTENEKIYRISLKEEVNIDSAYGYYYFGLSVTENTKISINFKVFNPYYFTNFAIRVCSYSKLYPSDVEILNGYSWVYLMGCTIHPYENYNIYECPFSILEDIKYIAFIFESYSYNHVTTYVDIENDEKIYHISLNEEINLSPVYGYYFFGLSPPRNTKMSINIKVFKPFKDIDFVIKICGFSKINPSDEEIIIGNSGCIHLYNYTTYPRRLYEIYEYPFSLLEEVNYLSIYFESYTGNHVSISINDENAEKVQSVSLLQ